ncbi:hypothetical protein A2U01_0057955, partial [Trifolium medium]|nr:hypothetical protein [Trifolium medium]
EIVLLYGTDAAVFKQLLGEESRSKESSSL